MTTSAETAVEILRAVFDALPCLVFVVDEDVRFQEYNATAGDLVAAERSAVLRRRAGEVLNCVHSTDVPGGCGRGPFCKDCIIRDSVTEAFRGNRVARRRARMEFVREGTKTEFYALITASPFVFRDRSLALLVIEDIGELAELHRLIPVCSVCKKVRDDKELWMQIEAYFRKNWDIGFTHGYCPECYGKEMIKLEELIKARKAEAARADKPHG